jgi:SAM-dependent methyltransferase
MGDWWMDELAGDPAYEDEVTPLVMRLAQPTGRVLDVGCGEGRIMKVLAAAGCTPVGIDIARSLLRRASEFGEVVRAELPMLDWCDDGVFDGSVVSLVLEHLPDHVPLLQELARVVRSGGILTVVVNHPIYTAPDSAPIEDSHGEVLWRPGRYFGTGFTDEPAGDRTVRFHHRTLGDLLTDASAAGWGLEELHEIGVTDAQVDRHPPLASQRHIPRLLGIRWRRR